MIKPLDGEIELIRQTATGDAEAFAPLVRHYKDHLYNYVLQMTRDVSETDDIVQESFIKAFQNLSRFNISLSFAAWLFTIAVNLTRNRMKRKKLIRFLSLDFARAGHEDEKRLEIADRAPTPEDVAQRRSDIDQANAIVRRLPEKYRTVFILRHIEQFSYADIAVMTALPLGTVETRIHRANKLAIKSYRRASGGK